MRILFIVNYVEARAARPHAGIFVEREANALRRRGVDVDVFDIGRRYSPMALFRKAVELRRVIRERRPDLLHAQYGTVVALFAVLSSHPTVITFSGSDLLPGASISRLRTWTGIVMSNIASIFARRVICVSGELRRAMWWRRRGVSVIPRGVDLDLFRAIPRAEARHRLAWPEDQPVALFAGTGDAENKGLPLARAAVECARASLPGLVLRVVDQVEPADMPLYYSAADVLVFASRQEGSPNAVKESLACALPVVSVRVGDVEERLQGVEPSAIVERDPQQIAAAVVAMATRPRRSNGPAAAARLSLDRMAEQIARVYSEALGSS